MEVVSMRTFTIQLVQTIEGPPGNILRSDDKVERVLRINGKTVFSEAATVRNIDQGLLYKIMWDCELLSDRKSFDEKTQRSGNAADDRRNPFRLIWKRWFKGFNFKNKFLQVLFK